ncbi:MAG: bacteriocin system secretion protein [Pseudomonadota bacterium]|nr:bacteriocin system secretion protein [Pseudomonadota bacterium]
MMIFRPQALAKVTNPDQLDQTLRIVRPRHVLGFGVVAVVMVAGLIWSLISTAPVKVAGPGVLLSPSGVAAITAPAAGHVDQLFIRPGDQVMVDQAIALLRNPEQLDQLRAADAEASEVRERYQALQAEFAAQDRLQAGLLKRLRAAYAERVATLEAQTATLTKRYEGEAKLRERGIVSGVNLFQTEIELAQVQNELATARNRVTELELEYEQQSARRRQDLAELRIRAQNLTRAADNLRRDYERNRQVLATSAGAITEIGVDLHDPVVSGQVIARLLVADASAAGLTTLAYLPAAEGKKVKLQMTARVAPSTIKFEREGYVLGRVVRVAELPASREGLLRRLRNAVLVDDMLKGGAPFEVEVELQRNPQTPSGYAWTSGEGPDIRLEPGTLARTEVVVERIPLISLLFPAMEYVYGWFKSL